VEEEFAGTVQPDSQKSGPQEVADLTTGNTNTDDSVLDKAKRAVGLDGQNE